MGRRMWANRPTFRELLFMAILVMATQVMTGLPVLLLTVAAVLLMGAMTARMAVTDLRRWQAPAPTSPAEGGGPDED